VAARGKIIERSLLFAPGLEAMRGAGLVFETADDLNLAVRLQVVDTGAVHLLARGKHATLGRGLGSGFLTIGGEVFGFNRGVETFAAAGKKIALEGGAWAAACDSSAVT
jgi:hypothetical protein